MGSQQHKDRARTFLVVDDEETVRRVVAGMLNGLGHQVVEAKNGAQAVDLYRRHKEQISGVLLDLMMPDMDGHDCLKALRRIDPQVAAILVTGYGDDDRIRAMIQDGLSGVLLKPFSMSDLRSAVARIVP